MCIDAEIIQKCNWVDVRPVKDLCLKYLINGIMRSANNKLHSSLTRENNNYASRKFIRMRIKKKEHHYAYEQRTRDCYEIIRIYSGAVAATRIAAHSHSESVHCSRSVNKRSSGHTNTYFFVRLFAQSIRVNTKQR